MMLNFLLTKWSSLEKDQQWLRSNGRMFAVVQCAAQLDFIRPQILLALKNFPFAFCKKTRKKYHKGTTKTRNNFSAFFEA